MKNRCLVGILMAVAMVLTPFFAFSQVKQVFQVIHFDTKRPIAGATNTLFGQTLTTNAQGIAVANLPADKKGAFLPMDWWTLDGYAYLGRKAENRYDVFQTKDTIRYYMVELPTYRKAVNEAFETLFRFEYQKNVLPASQIARDSVTANPDQAVAYANQLMEATFDNSNVRMCRDDAKEINKYAIFQFDKPEFSEVLRVLNTGDVNRAVAMAKEHIDLKDNSRANLDWISFYLFLRDLELASDDEDPLSDYAEVLYRNHYAPNSTPGYISMLNRNSDYAKADSLIRIEKANNKDPRYANTFISSFVQYLTGEDNAKLKTVSDEHLENALKMYRMYPCRATYEDIYWNYKNMYYTYLILEDSASATRMIDSSIASVNHFLDLYAENNYSKNQTIIDDYHRILDVVTVDLSYLPETTVYQLYDGIYNAAKENYDSDTASLFLKLQLAENAVLWLRNASQFDETGEKRMALLRQLVQLDESLSKEFPDFYTPQNVQISSQLLANCLMQGCDNEKMLDAFHHYEQSYDAVSVVYPNTFDDIFLRFNNIIDGYLASNQMFTLTSELNAFNDRLLSHKAGNDPQKLLVLKAENANKMAESLYEEEAYDEAINYYLQSNEYYEKVLPQDEQLWVPYLRNYLQMGDAHLYQNQIDKASMTYKRILDFESQVPATQMPQYTRMKGNVYYYIGDVYKATGDLSNAEKSYKTAEKWFKKAVAMGDIDAYQSMGEMYWGKAVIAAQQENMKKCFQLVKQSVDFYDKTDMEIPLNTYERAKSVLAAFYEEQNDAENYYRTTGELAEYYKKYIEYDDDYAVKLVQSAEAMLGSSTITNEEALRYSGDIVSALVYLDASGRDVQLPFLRSLFNLARAYVANDSVEEAIDLYKNCQVLNETMYKDTAVTTYKSNLAEVYTKLVNCYEKMAEEIDTAHSELWYYRAIDTRDTLIDLLKDLSSDGDVNMTYRTAIQYRNNGGVFYHLDMYPSAQDYLDKSNELLMMLYNSEYKTEVEDDLIHNYVLKGIFYEEADNLEKATEFLRLAVSYGEKADLSEQVPPYYYVAIASLLEILQKDKTANAAEINKLTKQMKEIAKKLK